MRLIHGLTTRRFFACADSLILEAFLLDRWSSFAYATGVEQSHGSAANTLGRSKYALTLVCFIR
jgi:hypothetical protein